MRLNETLQSLLRRWYLVLLGLLVTAGMSWYMFNYIQPSYEAQGSILLMPAKKIVGDHGNPYLYLGGMSEVVDVLVRRSNAAESVDPIVKQFAGSEIATTADRTTSSPVVVVDITATTSDTTLAALKAALSTVTRNLESMQNELKVVPDMRISTKELVVDDVVKVNSKMQIQMAIVVAAAGAVGTLLVTGFLDGVLQMRKSRKSEGEDESKEKAASGTETVEEAAAEDTRVALLPGVILPAKLPAQKRRSKP